MKLFFTYRADGSKFVGSVHHQVNEKLAAAALLRWTSGVNATSLTVAAKYDIDKDTFLKVILNTLIKMP